MPQEVERIVTIAASPERVWQAWVNEMNAWWTKPYYNDHDLVTGLRMEPCLGGRYIEEWGKNGEGFLIGQITVWLPPRRLAYTWTQRDWEGIITLIEIELEAEGENNTRFTLMHHGFDRLPEGAVIRNGYQRGSTELIDRLKDYVEGRLS